MDNNSLSDNYIKSLIDNFWYYFKIIYLAGSVYTVLVPILNLYNIIFIHTFWHLISFIVYCYNISL